MTTEQGEKLWGASRLSKELCDTFGDRALFDPGLVIDKRNLQMYRVHSRVCGLLARIGVDAGFLADVCRRHPIDPVQSAGSRMQRQAEADLTFVDPSTDKPVTLLDYETGDAPISKMRGKFRYLDTFIKHTPSIKLVALLLTSVGVQHSWESETEEQRTEFVSIEVPKLIESFFAKPHNVAASFVVAVFYRDRILVTVYDREGPVSQSDARYGSVVPAT